MSRVSDTDGHQLLKVSLQSTEGMFVELKSILKSDLLHLPDKENGCFITSASASRLHPSASLHPPINQSSAGQNISCQKQQGQSVFGEK